MENHGTQWEKFQRCDPLHGQLRVQVVPQWIDPYSTGFVQKYSISKSSGL